MKEFPCEGRPHVKRLFDGGGVEYCVECLLKDDAVIKHFERASNIVKGLGVECPRSRMLLDELDRARRLIRRFLDVAEVGGIRTRLMSEAHEFLGELVKYPPCHQTQNSKRTDGEVVE